MLLILTEFLFLFVTTRRSVKLPTVESSVSNIKLSEERESFAVGSVVNFSEGLLQEMMLIEIRKKNKSAEFFNLVYKLTFLFYFILST